MGSKRGVDHAHVAAVLLAAGCSVDARDAQGRTPLHLAAGAGLGGSLLPPAAAALPRFVPATVLQWLQQALVLFLPLDSHLPACLHCMQHALFASAGCVLVNSANPTHRASSLPCLRAGAGCSQMVQQFLRLSQDWDAADGGGWTPLFWACSTGHGECGCQYGRIEGWGV